MDHQTQDRDFPPSSWPAEPAIHVCERGWRAKPRHDAGVKAASSGRSAAVWTRNDMLAYDEGRFILQVVGSVSSATVVFASVFQPRPVFSTSFFTSLVNTAS